MSERSATSGRLSPLRARGRGPGVGGQGRTRGCRLGFSFLVLLLLLLSAFCLLPTVSPAEEIIFLHDGRTIRAEKVEIIGDRVRIERPSETIELPRSDVLSIHPISPPQVSPNSPAPSEVYRDMTPQMVDKIRREIQGQSEPSGRR